MTLAVEGVTKCSRCGLTKAQIKLERKYGGTFMCWVGLKRFSLHDWGDS